MSLDSYYKKITLQEDEEIVGVIHIHPIIFAPKIALAVLIFLAPFFFMFRLIAQGSLGVSVFFTLIIGSVIFTVREYYVWKYNVFILTTNKIVDFDQRGFFSRQVSEIAYPKIVDIAYEAKGVFNTIFRMGVITVKTNVPNLGLRLEHVGGVKDVCGQLIEMAQERGGHIAAVPLTSAQKMEHVDDFLRQEKFDSYEQYSLKELLSEYISVYSKEKLKKLLADELNRGKGANNSKDA